MKKKRRVENKKEDKKFLGKFLLILMGAFLVGIVSGFCMAFLEDFTQLPELISAVVKGFLVTVAPYVSVVFSIVMAFVLVVTHKRVSIMIELWDGENEEKYEKMDAMLGNALTALSIGMVITYFFFAIGFDNTVERSTFADCCYFFGFVAALFIIVVGQSALVKLTKQINPEKQGCVYDTKFIDKWEDSCDEAEKILIYKSAYKTYAKMSSLYVGLWIFCVFGNAVFHFGFVPVTMVSVLWLGQVCFYTHYSKYYSKHPEKIGVFK